MAAPPSTAPAPPGTTRHLAHFTCLHTQRQPPRAAVRAAAHPREQRPFAPSIPDAPTPTRRHALHGLACTVLLSTCPSAPARSAQPAAQVLYVQPPGAIPSDAATGTYLSINAALAASAPGPVRIRVAAGRYPERLVIADRQDVVIEAATEGAAVEVVWEAARPYESVVDCGANTAGVVLQGLTLRHYSKSVANNYAVALHSGSQATLAGCDVSSTSGSGVGIEGAAPTIVACRVHGCRGNGVCVFAGLEDGLGDDGAPSGGTVQDCVIEGNGLDGILVRGAEPSIRGNTIRGNKGSALALQDCGGLLEGNKVVGNVRAARWEGSPPTAAGLLERNSVIGNVQLE